MASTVTTKLNEELTMLRKILIALLLMLSFTANAEDINYDAAANDMYAHYIGYSNGQAAMMGAEQECWSNMGGNITAAKYCIASAMAGSLIEAAYAMQEMRVAVPNYNPLTVHDRIVSNMSAAGFTKEQIKSALNYMRDNSDKIIVGLFNAGMR